MMSHVLQCTQFDALICRRGAVRVRQRSRTRSQDRTECTDDHIPCRRWYDTPRCAPADATVDLPRGACPRSARSSACRTSAADRASARAAAWRCPDSSSLRMRRCPGSLGTAWRIHQPVGQHLQSGEGQAAEQAVFERLVHVLHGPHLGANPALRGSSRRTQRASLRTCRPQRRRRTPSRRRACPSSSRGECLSAAASSETRRIADDERAVDRTFRQRQPPAFRQRLRTIANHLAAPQQLADKRMQLELLKCDMRIERGSS